MLTADQLEIREDEKQGQTLARIARGDGLPTRIKLYYIATPSFSPIIERHFLRSIPASFEPVALPTPPQFDSAKWGTDAFHGLMQWGQREIVRLIRENQGSIIAFAGGDTMFFGDPMPVIAPLLRKHDFIIAPNTPNALKMCPEFMVIRCNTETLAYHETVAKCCHSANRNDSLMTALSGMVNFAVLPHKLFWNLGQDKGEYEWTPADKTPLPPREMLWFHANWCKGVENKMKLLEAVKVSRAIQGIKDEQSSNPVKLNIGAGNSGLEGYIAIDRKLGSEAFPLSYADNSVDEIRASHILEHFNFSDAQKALKEWHRVLKPSGVIQIAVPDFDKIVELRRTDPKWQFYLCGGQTDANDQHLSTWTKELLTSHMNAVGFAVTKWIGDARDTSSHCCSLNLTGTKAAGATVAEMPESFARELGTPPPCGKKRAKIAAIVSLPRVCFTDFWGEAVESLKTLGIPLWRYGGAFWEQGVQNLFEDRIKEGYDIILTLDYDTVCTTAQIDLLIKHLCEDEDIDALAALQVKRSSHYPLLTAFGKKQCEMNGRPFQVSTAHFGLTAIRLSAVEELPKPWFHGQPDRAGTWRGEDRLDADIFFWHQWRLEGRKLFVDPAVSIGHLEIMVSEFDEQFKVRHLSINEWRESQKIAGKVE